MTPDVLHYLLSLLYQLSAECKSCPFGRKSSRCATCIANDAPRMLQEAEMQIRGIFKMNRDRVRYEDVVLYTLETSHKPLPENAFALEMVGKTMSGRSNVFRKLFREGKIRREKRNGIFFYSIVRKIRKEK